MTKPYLHIALMILLASCNSDVAPNNETTQTANASNSNNNTTVVGNPTYSPNWGSPLPTPQISQQFAYDLSQTALENGNRLQTTIASLTAGAQLTVAEGDYLINTSLIIDLVATADAPIVIKGVDGARPKLISADTTLPLVTLGQNSATQFVYLGGFELSGGSLGVAVGNASDLWLDQLDIHSTADSGLRTTSGNIHGLYLTRSNIHDTGSEGIRLWKLFDSVIALNKITDTTLEGIALSEDCYNTRIARNYIHHLKDNPTLDYPGIRIWHGPLAEDKPVNIIEKNVVHDILDNCIQLEGGQARVSNNLVFNCKNKGIDLTHGTTFQEIPAGSGNWYGVSSVVNRVWIVNNTVFNLNDGNGIGLGSWIGASIGQDQLFCVNNAIYMRVPTGGTSPFSILFSDAAAVEGGEVHDNMIFGSPVLNTPASYTWTPASTGNALTDFTNINSAYVVTSQETFINDARPKALSPLNGNGLGAGAATFDSNDDLTDRIRTAPREVGALDTL